MSQINLDCDSLRENAIIAAGSDCSDSQWGAIRRFFEERFPQLVVNQHRSLQVPWWAFLSLREALRIVLSVHRITSLQLSEVARQMLAESLNRSDQYKNAALLTPLAIDVVQNRLNAQGWKRRLMPFQARNVARLSALPAAATFSVPGAGKTTEALACFYLWSSPEDRLLVVAPKNAFVAWEDELPECVPDCGFSFVRLTGGYERIRELLSVAPKAVIITYHQLHLVRNSILSYLGQNQVHLFIDESHRMKRGYEGAHGSAVLSLAALAKRRLILSGTPMPNAITDLVPQFAFLYPEQATSTDGVIDRFNSVYVRTTKSEMGLAPPHRLLRDVEMLPGQSQLYQGLASEAGRLLLNLNARDKITLRRIARSVQYLIQAASNPALLVNSDLSGHDLLEAAIAEGLPRKLQVACALARTWVNEGQKVVIWSTFVKTVEHLSRLLSDCGASFIHGGVQTGEDDDSEDTRERRIRDFNNPNSDCRVLVANPAACSEGISLHKVCHRAIYVDRNYNAGQYLQSEDRIHRIGLPPTTETIITVLQSPGTLDESVGRRLVAKVALMRDTLDDPNLNIRPLDLDEEDDLLGLTPDDIEDIRRVLRVG